MRVNKPQKLSLLTRCFEHERRFYLGVAILALHDFSRALTTEADMWKFLPQELGKDGVPDAGMPKSRGEFLVTGAAYPPGRESRPSCDVSVQLGNLEKRLRVIGNRQWKWGGATEPEPFLEMPITWENAFGGAGYGLNPLGKGFAPLPSDDGKLHPLPNVELPRKLVKSKGDFPEPASFGPIDVMWPQRAKKAGTYDKRWLEEQYPGFAQDMDWSIFNVAGEDQQQPEPFRGDEAFVIEGMHPDRSLLEGQLPRMATRCFVTQRTAKEEAFREIPMKLTTVWFFPHAERYLLIFHGAQQLQEEDAADVLQLMIAAEDLGQPKPTEHYQQVLKQRLDPDTGVIHSLRDGDLLPAAPEITAGVDHSLEEMKGLLATDGIRQKIQRAGAERVIEKERALLVSLGLDPDLHGPAPMAPDEPLPNLEDIPAMKARLDGEMKEQLELVARREQELEDRVYPMLQAEGLDADTIIAERKQKRVGPPTYSAEAELQKLRTLADECNALGCPIDEFEMYLTDPGHRQRLVAGEHEAREGYRTMAHHQDAAPRLSGEQAARSKEAALSTLASQGNLSRLNLTGFDLSGLDLRGADLSGSWLENANLAGTNLAAANLSEAVLARADLTDANLTNANLAKANLGLAQWIRTKADVAVLSEAILSNARLEGASLRGAKLDSADLMETTFAAADLSGAELAGSIFLPKTDLRGLSLRGANLSNCNFLETDVRGVDFTGARLDGANFISVKGDGAVLAKAQLTKVCFVQGCSFAKATFREANLASINLRGSCLTECDFSQARLPGADLSECDLSRANFFRAYAVGSLFVKARFREADLRSADLMNAILQNADLLGADLRGANLFKADLARVYTDKYTQLEGANRKKARVLPQREPA